MLRPGLVSEDRILVLMPTSQDAVRTCEMFEMSGLVGIPCVDIEAVCRELKAGAGVILLTDEAMRDGGAELLLAALDDQPAWSDLPLVLLSREGSGERSVTFHESVNATLVERPVRMRTLLSVVQSGLRARRRQYEVRDHLAERQRSAETISAERELLKVTLASIGDAVISTDAEGRVNFLNGVAEALTGYSRAEAIGKPLTDVFHIVNEHTRQTVANPAIRALQEQVIVGLANHTNVVMQTRTIMERQLSHMVRLIDDLLDVSRISRNKMELRRVRVQLADVVANAVETARPLIEAGEHNLFVSLPSDSILLDVDLTRLAQVFSNLLSNSAKYTPHGGNIWLTAERRGEEAVISVRDDGIGIPHESLSSIFDMFSQVDRSIERSTGGLGIGLALVKGLVEMHGGSVQAECTEPGRGSTFTVTLPLQQNRASLEGHPRPLDGPSGDGVKWRVLVVDDNKDSANSMSMMLKLVGNEVRTANDGVEALRVGEEFRPEVILMDVGMPKLNGYEATRCIRERQWGRAIIVIALTGWGQEADRIQSRNAGCDGHLVKPVSLTELQELLSKLNSETGNRGWKKC